MDNKFLQLFGKICLMEQDLFCFLSDLLNIHQHNLTISDRRCTGLPMFRFIFR